MSRNTVIFDLGNVLIRWDPRRLYRPLFLGREEEMEWFLTHVCHPAWNEKLDAGHPFSDGIRERCEAFPAYSHFIQAYSQRWPEMLGGEITANVRILEDLSRQKIPVFALTNWSSETFPHAKRQFRFLDLFDGIVVSGEEKAVKPDPRIFHILFSRYRLDPSQCVFIDDAAANIETAKALGLATVHYTPEVNVKKALREFGIPLSSHTAES